MKKFLEYWHQYFSKKKSRLQGSWNSSVYVNMADLVVVSTNQRMGSWDFYLQVSHPSKKDLLYSIMTCIIKKSHLFVSQCLIFFPFLEISIIFYHLLNFMYSPMVYISCLKKTLYLKIIKDILKLMILKTINY